MQSDFTLIKTESEIPIYTKGEPSFDNLAKWEREALINPLLEVIKNFYKDPENKRKYENWKAEKYKKCLADAGHFYYSTFANRPK